MPFPFRPRFAVSAAIIVALLGVAPPRAARSISGVVFVDRNGNGIRDAGEAGMANVVVSNQETVAVTDQGGAFQISNGRSGVVFVSVPDGYRAVGKFWRTATDGSTLSFALAASPAPARFTFIHASDTHLSPASVDRTRRLRAIVDSVKPDFVIITGDLVRDALRVGEAEATSYYDLATKEFAALPAPVWTVPGNHENFGIERNQSHVDQTHPLYARGMYHHYFGPDYYSFTRGGIHFVGLNSVDIDDMWYYGHVDSLQLAWLERDLEHVPASMPVVTFNHIPFASAYHGFAGYLDTPPAPSAITVNGKTSFRHVVSNASDVLAIVRKRKYVLALGGHFHIAERIVMETDGQKTRFEQTAAVVGPSQVGQVTFPSGVTVYSVSSGVVDAGRFVSLLPPK